MLILSFTTLPYWMYYGLSQSPVKLKQNPDYIIVLGGDGMPSPTGLMRTYKAAEKAKKFSGAKIIIALPGDTADTSSSLILMKRDIMFRGIDSNRIFLEPEGKNTREQALKISKIIPKKSICMIISAPEHIYRSVKVFNKLGFKNAGGSAAYGRAIESRLQFDDDELGGNKNIPEVGSNLQLRYQFWNHLKYEITVFREYVAIMYYKLKGWI